MRPAHHTPFVIRAIALAAVLLVAAVARADIDPAWIGAWMGEVAPPAAGRSAPIPTTVVVRNSAQGLAITVTSVRAGALDRGATDIAADGRSLAFSVALGARRARLEASLSDDGASATGSFTLAAADGAPAAGAAQRWSLHRVDLVGECAGARVYSATLDALGQKIPMRLSLGEGPHGWCGSLDIVAQGLSGLAVPVERTAAGGFRVAVPVGTPATIELTPSADAKSLEGTFTQGAFSAPIRFDLVDGASAGAARRPQDPHQPLPYTAVEVRIPHPAGHTLAGTLCIPSNERLARAGLVPAVVLVTGSGPQNRDEELMGHRPFAVIADSLARAGIAVLRYDDRGTGASGGTFAGSTTIDFATDADAASEWLKAQKGIDPARVGMLGHSEGALIAPIVAAWQNAGDAPVHPLAFTVLLAPPAEDGGATLVRQTARMYEVANLDPQRIAAAVAAHRAAVGAAGKGADDATMRTLVEALVRAQLALQPTAPLTDAQVRPLVDAAVKQLADPWMRAFIALDPAGALARGEAPTLAMWGTKDVQVVAEPNRALLREIAARSGAPVEARLCEGLNHLFQPATTGLPDEYAAIDITFDPSTLAEMTEWIAETAKSLPARQIPEASRPSGWDSAPLPARPVAAAKEHAP